MLKVHTIRKHHTEQCQRSACIHTSARTQSRTIPKQQQLPNTSHRPTFGRTSDATALRDTNASLSRARIRRAHPHTLPKNPTCRRVTSLLAPRFHLCVSHTLGSITAETLCFRVCTPKACVLVCAFSRAQSEDAV